MCLSILGNFLAQELSIHHAQSEAKLSHTTFLSSHHSLDLEEEEEESAFAKVGWLVGWSSRGGGGGGFLTILAFEKEIFL